MPNTNTKTNWKQKCGELEDENQALRQQLQELAAAAEVLAKDKEQVERELSSKRTENAALTVQLEKIVQAIQSQQTAADEDETGDLAEVIPITPSDGAE